MFIIARRKRFCAGSEKKTPMSKLYLKCSFFIRELFHHRKKKDFNWISQNTQEIYTKQWSFKFLVHQSFLPQTRVVL